MVKASETENCSFMPAGICHVSCCLETKTMEEPETAYQSCAVGLPVSITYYVNVDVKTFR